MNRRTCPLCHQEVIAGQTVRHQTRTYAAGHTLLARPTCGACNYGPALKVPTYHAACAEAATPEAERKAVTHGRL